MELKAAGFATRDDLEKFVAGQIAATTEPKDHVITGTREQLARLNLTDRTTVWGIKCEITDTPTIEAKQGEKPDRGQRFAHGINLEGKQKKNE